MGQEQSYRRTTPGKMKIGLYGEQVGGAPFEVGTYTPQDLDSGLNYTPLGAYDPAQVTVSDTGQTLTPTRNAQGLAAQPSSAIVSLQGAQELTDEDFISAVRIRVAGLDGLTRAEAQRRVAAQASRDERLRAATHVIDASRPLPDMLQQVRALWDRLKGPSNSRGTSDRSRTTPSRTG